LIFSFFSLLVEISITSPHLWKKDGGGRMFHGEVKGGGGRPLSWKPRLNNVHRGCNFLHPPTHSPKIFPIW
jgi:hypothetical protein